MITIIRSIIVAFSLYSKIPMPIFEWKKEDMKYAIAMLPLVGVVIAAVEYAILYVLNIYDAPLFIRTCVWAVIPLLLTGGFHVDGYMDVQDALKSYKPAEEKLRILKDPHIGAFSVISFGTFGLIYMAVSAGLIEYIGGKESQEATSLMVFMSLGFVLARILCVIVSIVFKHAKADGMLHEETKDTGKQTLVIAIVEMTMCLCGMFFISIGATLAVIMVLGIYTCIYRRRMYKEFGGINGDMAGYYLVNSELVYVCAMGIAIICGMM